MTSNLWGDGTGRRYDLEQGYALGKVPAGTIGYAELAVG
jgi:hypothetical protein